MLGSRELKAEAGEWKLKDPGGCAKQCIVLAYDDGEGETSRAETDYINVLFLKVTQVADYK